MLKKTVSIIVLAFCFFNNSTCMFVESLRKNMHDRQIDKDLGKTVFSFVNTLNGCLLDQWLYTTELSRLLLVGEPQMFEQIRYIPLISIISAMGPLFDNRFNDFIKKVGHYSQKQLQEAIKDAILLSPYNTKAYSVGKLLDHLSESLQNEIAYTKAQIEHDFKWDQRSFYALKKSVILSCGLNVFVAMAKERKELELFHAIAVLSLLPASCGVVKGFYNVLATDPNAYNHCLEKYEKLLVFVQNLKMQLEANGSITFKLTNGRIAIVKNNKLIFNE